MRFSWGYDQTNIDFYQVVEVKENTVTIREIAQKSVYMGEGYSSMSGYVIPEKDHFIGEPMLKHVHEGNSVTMASYGYCSLWEGKPEYTSWYA